MKFCPKCGNQLEDGVKFCPKCGASLPEASAAKAPESTPVTPVTPVTPIAPAPAPAPAAMPVPAAAPVPDDTDHTAEFDAKDISDNKVFAMSCYLLGVFGIIIALLGSNKSEYAAFHARQSLKISICLILLMFVNIVPFLGTVVYGIGTLVLAVVKIICFFSVCKGEAKEPPIIKGIKFLK